MCFIPCGSGVLEIHARIYRGHLMCFTGSDSAIMPVVCGPSSVAARAAYHALVRQSTVITTPQFACWLPQVLMRGT